jgi:hypothetical protein
MSLPVLSHWPRTGNARSMLVKLSIGLFAIVFLMRLIDGLAH